MSKRDSKVSAGINQCRQLSSELQSERRNCETTGQAVLLFLEVQAAPSSV
jgi:hypothetical protein